MLSKLSPQVSRPCVDRPLCASAWTRGTSVGRALSLAALVVAPAAVGQTFQSSVLASSSNLFSEVPTKPPVELELGPPVRVPSNLAMEVDYWDLGETLHNSGVINTSGVNLAARAAWPFAQQWSMYSKLGVFLWQTQDVTARQLGALREGATLTYAGGMAWSLAQSLALNLEYTVFELNGVDGDGVGFGLTYRF